MASEDYVKLGEASLVGGHPLDVLAGPDSTVILYEPDSTISFTFSDTGVDELRELLDRAAMPGQPSRVKHGPWCDCTPCKAEPSYEACRSVSG